MTETMQQINQVLDLIYRHSTQQELEAFIMLMYRTRQFCADPKQAVFFDLCYDSAIELLKAKYPHSVLVD